MKILYLGLDIENFSKKAFACHFPVIKIIPNKLDKLKLDFSCYTHYIFTSKRSVKIFCEHLIKNDDLTLLRTKKLIAIGTSTSLALKKYTLNSIIPRSFSQEGIIELLKGVNLNNSSFFIPRSAIARKILDDFFMKNEVKFDTFNLYNTIVNIPKKKINLFDFNEVFFTSPSTVKAFIQIFPKIPSHLKFKTIGPVTQNAVDQYLIRYAKK